VNTWTTCARSSGESKKVEESNISGDARELPTAPMGCRFVRRTVKLMFDLQAVAFAADVTACSRSS